ncbi:MAG: hypothetical protein MJE77_24630 [Proteobacteria bacterium]|nr:hypothetical protein [Pseudomonadota bacterium]
MKRVKRLCLVAAIVAVPVACYHHARDNSFESNFSAVRVAEGGLVAAATGQPYSGPLIARDEEITAVAQIVFRGTPLEGAANFDTSGLILVVPVENGALSGRAALHVDLRSPKLSAELTRRRDRFSLAIAGELAATIKLAEATFEAGKLDGTAIILAPASQSSTRLSKIAEAEFRNNLLHGTAREYFRGTEQRRRELTFKRGVRSGPQRQYYASGALERESIYLDGRAHGKTIEYYENGAKRAEAIFERGRAVGRRERWFPTGQRHLEIVTDQTGGRAREWYSNGKLKSSISPDEHIEHPPEGLIVEYHRNGAVRSRTHYVGGVKHGPFEVFYSDGNKWETGNFSRGRRHGPHKKWWKNGRLALDSTWADGALDSRFERWYASGQQWEKATYRAGKRVGHYQKWWKNGAPAHDYHYHYKNGKLDGDYRTFYDNGAKWALGKYSAGKPQGVLRRWFPDGRLGYLKHHKNGRADGPYKRWYSDGKLRLDATYVNGRLDGEFKNWLEDGSVYEFATFRRGKKITTTLKKPTTTSAR